MPRASTTHDADELEPYALDSMSVVLTIAAPKFSPLAAPI